jgi:hypothetical protein
VDSKQWQTYNEALNLHGYVHYTGTWYELGDPVFYNWSKEHAKPLEVQSMTTLSVAH